MYMLYLFCATCQLRGYKTDVQNFYREILYITANCILRFLGFCNYSSPLPIASLFNSCSFYISKLPLILVWNVVKHND